MAEAGTYQARKISSFSRVGPSGASTMERVCRGTFNIIPSTRKEFLAMGLICENERTTQKGGVQVDGRHSVLFESIPLERAGNICRSFCHGLKQLLFFAGTTR